MHIMAPLSRLSALPEETRQALAGLQLRSDVHAHLRACEQAARQATDQRAPSPTLREDARADPLEALIQQAAASTSLRLISGIELDARARAAVPLPTGSTPIDALLCGGLRPGELVELSGPPSSGKTQLCLSAAAANAAAGRPVLYLDSTGGFSAARVAELQQHSRAAPATAEAARQALGGVRAARAFDVHAALALLDALLRGERGAPSQDAAGDGEEAQQRPALLICDSASALLSPLLTTAHPQGRALMLTLTGALRALADEHAVAVLLTNHTVSGRDGDTGSLKPALGETWKSQPHTRIQLSMPPASSIRADAATVCSAEVTLGRGRGRRAQYVLAADGLIAPAQLYQRGGGH